MGETLEDGTTLGSISGTLEKVGVDVLDANGELRDMGTIIEDLMVKWDNFETAEKQALAIKLAGRYQYTRFLALMENSDMYYSTLNESSTAAGFLDQTQETYMESLTAKIESMQAAWEGLVSEIFDPDDIKPFLDVLTDVINGFTTIADAIDLGDNALSAFSATFFKLFNKKISASLNSALENYGITKTKQNNQEMATAQLKSMGVNAYDNQDLVNYMVTMRGSTSLTEEQTLKVNETIDAHVQSLNELAQVNEKMRTGADATNQAFRIWADTEADLIDINGELTESYLALYADDKQFFTNFRKELDSISVGKPLDALRQLKIGFNDLASTSNRSEKSFKGLADSLELYASEGKLAGTITQQLNGYIKKLEQASGNEELYARVLAEANGYMDKTIATLMSLDKNMLLTADDTLKLANQQRYLAESAKMSTEAMNQQVESIGRQETISNVVSMASAVSQLGFALQSLQNVTDIMSDSDMTVGEKTVQVLLDVSIALPMIVSGVAELRTAMAAIQAANWKDLLTDMATPLKDILTNVLGLNKAVEGISQSTIATVRSEQIALLEKEKAATQKDIAVQQDYISTLQWEAREVKTLSGQQKERSSLETKLSAARKRLNQEVKERNALLTKETALTEKEIATLQNLDSKIERSEKTVESLRGKVSKFNSEIALTESRLKKAQEKLERLRKELGADSKQVKEAEASLEELNARLKKLDAEQAAAATEALTVSEAMYALAAGSLTAGAAIKVVKNALKSFLPILAGIVATEAVMYVWDYFANSAERAAEKIEELQEAAEEASSALTELQDAQDAFEEQYDLYKETGEITDELKDALVEYNKVLGNTISAEGIRKQSIDDLVESTENYAKAQKNLALRELVDAKNSQFNETAKGVTSLYEDEVVFETRTHRENGYSNDDYAFWETLYDNWDVLGQYITDDDSREHFFSLVGIEDGKLVPVAGADQEKVYRAIAEITQGVALDDSDKFAGISGALSDSLSGVAYILDYQTQAFQTMFDSLWLADAIAGMELDESGALVNIEDAEALVSSMFDNDYVTDMIQAAGYDGAQVLIEGVLGGILGENYDYLIQAHLDDVDDVYAKKIQEIIKQDANYSGEDAAAVDAAALLDDINAAFGGDVTLPQLYKILQKSMDAGIDFTSLQNILSENNGAAIQAIMEQTGLDIYSILTNPDFFSALTADSKDIEGYQLGDNVREWASSIEETNIRTQEYNDAIEANVEQQLKIAELQGQTLDEEEAQENATAIMDILNSIENDSVREAALREASTNGNYTADMAYLAKAGITGVSADEAEQWIEYENWAANALANSEYASAYSAETAGGLAKVANSYMDQLAEGDEETKEALWEIVSAMDPTEAIIWMATAVKNGVNGSDLVSLYGQGLSDDEIAAISATNKAINANRVQVGLEAEDYTDALAQTVSTMIALGYTEQEIIDQLAQYSGISFDADTETTQLSVIDRLGYGDRYAASSDEGQLLSSMFAALQGSGDYELLGEVDAATQSTFDAIMELADGDAEVAESLWALVADMDPAEREAYLHNAIVNGINGSDLVDISFYGFDKAMETYILTTSGKISNALAAAGVADVDYTTDMADVVQSMLGWVDAGLLTDAQMLSVMSDWGNNLYFDKDTQLQEAYLAMAGRSDIKAGSDEAALYTGLADTLIQTGGYGANDGDKLRADVNEIYENALEIAGGDVEAATSLVSSAMDVSSDDPDAVKAAFAEGVAEGMDQSEFNNVLSGYAKDVADLVSNKTAEINEVRALNGDTEIDESTLLGFYDLGEQLGLTSNEITRVIKNLGPYFDEEKIQQALIDLSDGISWQIRNVLSVSGADTLVSAYRTALQAAGGSGDEANDFANYLGNTFTDDQLTGLVGDWGGSTETLATILTNGNVQALGVEQQIQLVGVLDSSKTVEELGEQIAYINDNNLLPQIEVMTGLKDKADILQTAYDESSNGGISADTLKELEELYPEVYNEAKKYVDGSVDQQDYLREALRQTNEELERAEDSFDQDYGLDFDVDTGQFTDFEDEVEDWFENDYVLNVELATNAHDAVDDLIDSFSGVSDAIDSITDDYQVSLEEFDELASIFGTQLLENAYVTEDGLLQLDQATADAMIENREAEKDAAIQAQIDELTAEQQVAQTKADAYSEAAEKIANLSAMVADGQITDSQEVADSQIAYQTQAANAVSQASADESSDVETSASNQIENVAAVGEQSGQTFGDVAENAASGAASMAQSIYQAATNAIANLKAVGQAASDAMEGQETTAAAVELGAITSSYVKKDSGTVSTTAASEATTYEYSQVEQGDSKETILSKLAKTQAYYEQMAAAQQAVADKYALSITELQLAANSDYVKPSSRTSDSSGSSDSGSDLGTTELTEDELDRYERVDTALDKLANDFERIAEEQDRLTGDKLINNLQDQVSLLKQQADIQKQKLDIQRQELAEYDERLANEFGVTFTEDGYVANYAERFTYYLSYLNALESAYNAATSEEAQESIQEEIDAASDALSDYKDLIDKRDELFSNSIEESLKAIEDFYDQIEDLMAEAFNDSIDAIDNLKEINELMAELHQIGSGLKSDNPFREIATSLEKINKFTNAGVASDSLLGIIADNNAQIAAGGLTDNQVASLEGINSIYSAAASSGATSIVDMYAYAMEVIDKELDEYNNTGTSAIFGENSAALYDAMQTVLEGYKSAREEEEKYYETLESEIGSAISYQNDEIERRYGLYEDIDSSLEHQYNVIKLTKSESAYDDMNAILDAQVANINNKIKEKEAEKAYWEEIQKGLEEGSDNWNTLADKIQDCTEEIQSLIEDSISKLQEEYTNFTSSALDIWSSKLLGGDDLSWAQEQWELINRNADQYLDSVNSSYQIQKLQGQYLELLDGSNDLATQKQITAQMNEQLSYLRGQTKLSEYDVAYAQAQLEILQKQIALQEAQQNKSSMKLRRDSQGNYSYVYTANDDDVQSAESDLLDAQNNAYNLTKDNIVQIQSDMYSAVSSAYSQIQDIQDNMLLSQEEKNERIKFIIDETTEYIEGLAQQLGVSESNIVNDFIGMVGLLQDENSTSLQDVYNEVIDGNAEALDQIDERFSTSITKVLDSYAQVEEDTDALYDDLLDINEDYYSQLGDLLESGGDAYEQFTGKIEDALDATKDLTEGTQDFFEVLKDESGIMSSAQQALLDYAAQVADTNNKYADANQRADKLAEALTQEQQKTSDLSNALKIATSTSSSSGSGGDSSSSGSSGSANGRNADGTVDVSSLGVGQVFGFNGTYYYDSWGKAPSGNQYAGQAGAVKIDSYSATKYGGTASQTGGYDVHISTVNGGDLGWVDALQLFDTGGFTGEWSDPKGSGRLAVLHSKELVLNATDTENILAAVTAVRDLTVSLNDGVFESVVSMISGIGDLVAGAMGDQKLQQDIKIDASFPNVYNAEDIRDAILSLSDMASQYAYKRI